MFCCCTISEVVSARLRCPRQVSQIISGVSGVPYKRVLERPLKMWLQMNEEKTYLSHINLYAFIFIFYFSFRNTVAEGKIYY